MGGYGEGLYGAGLYGGDEPPGVPFLTRLLGPDAKLAVEIAWGADLMADADTWVWTDVTADVRQDPGISTTIGRADEASVSQPAACSFLLDNSSGAYSLGGQSSNWPNVRRNTPVRVSINLDGTSPVVIFQGYATGFTPSWNLAATVLDVQLDAAGTLRRLIQGAPPVLSALRRVLSSHPNVVAYWPMEDGERAERVAAVVGSAMTYSGTPSFAQSSFFDCSTPLPTMSSATFTGDVPAHSATGEIQVRCLIDIPTSGATNDTPLIRLDCSGSATTWEIRYETGTIGTARIRAYDRFGNSLVNQGVSAGLTGFRGQIGLQLREVSGDVEWDLDLLRLGAPTSVGFGLTLSTATVGTATRVVINGSGSNDSVTVGHVAVYDLSTAESENLNQVNAYSGESTTSGSGRLVRLSEENAVPLTLTGNVDGTSSPADQMGSQRVAPLIELLRECETADQGVLYDGDTVGLSYLTRRFKENQSAALTLDATELAPVFGPVDDDQRTRNRVQATRTGGSSAVVEDIDGPLGTSVVGIYDTSVQVNTFRDSSAQLYAGWLLSLGTIEGYRYPVLTVDLLAYPELASAWLSLRPGVRIDVTDLGVVLPGHPGETLSLIVEGLSNEIGPGTWKGTARCSSYEPWRIGVVAEESGDDGDYLLRLLSDGSTLAADISAGATSASVSTPSGPLWTTTSDDFPFVIDIGGVTATVTGISGASSPQTFTITGLEYAKTSGAEVTLHQPTRLGL